MYGLDALEVLEGRQGLKIVREELARWDRSDNLKQISNVASMDEAKTTHSAVDDNRLLARLQLELPYNKSARVEVLHVRLFAAREIRQYVFDLVL